MKTKPYAEFSQSSNVTVVSAISDLQWCLASLRKVLVRPEAQVCQEELSSDTNSSILHQLHIVYRELAAIDVVGHEPDVSVVTNLVGEAVRELEDFEELPGWAAESPIFHEGIVG